MYDLTNNEIYSNTTTSIQFLEKGIGFFFILEKIIY